MDQLARQSPILEPHRASGQIAQLIAPRQTAPLPNKFRSIALGLGDHPFQAANCLETLADSPPVLTR